MTKIVDKNGLFKVIKRWWWLVIVVTGVGIFAGWAATNYLIKPQFQSVSELVLRPKKSAPQDMSGEQINTTVAGYQDLVKSNFVLNPSRQQLRENGISVNANSLANNVSIQHQENSNLFRLIVTADTARKAQQINQTLSKVFAKRANTLSVTLRPIRISQAQYSGESIAPSSSFNMMVGGLIGLMISSLLLVVVAWRRSS
ncbi:MULTISPECIES: YveK family protein [Loigolactobacillus]|uniref:YveK family protein n=2 Tax=Lactobacillaceae TaxID=33958 RepID=UPI0007F16AAA|nr:MULTISPECIES: hypothetical protein [Loigolactobacillus]ANK60499.1 hypothetical protein AYR52_09675 [Loigolactobacillus backii]ANK65458.1 hypothetical protein AYR54_09550 [Loigolactobacillus backii]MDA5386881.1 hypothetical protein [Loigolactobacillus backii]MDA5389335.1 hypothetical protein [Loigolactobacillus backii]